MGPMHVIPTTASTKPCPRFVEKGVACESSTARNPNPAMTRTGTQEPLALLPGSAGGSACATICSPKT